MKSARVGTLAALVAGFALVASPMTFGDPTEDHPTHYKPQQFRRYIIHDEELYSYPHVRRSETSLDEKITQSFMLNVGETATFSRGNTGPNIIYAGMPNAETYSLAIINSTGLTYNLNIPVGYNEVFTPHDVVQISEISPGSARIGLIPTDGMAKMSKVSDAPYSEKGDFLEADEKVARHDLGIGMGLRITQNVYGKSPEKDVFEMVYGGMADESSYDLIVKIGGGPNRAYTLHVPTAHDHIVFPNCVMQVLEVTPTNLQLYIPQSGQVVQAIVDQRDPVMAR